MPTDMEDSIPKSVGIPKNVVSLMPKTVCMEGYQLSNCAILDYGNIECKEIIIPMMCIAALTAKSVSVWSTAIQEFLIGITVEGLTEILLLHTYM